MNDIIMDGLTQETSQTEQSSERHFDEIVQVNVARAKRMYFHHEVNSQLVTTILTEWIVFVVGLCYEDCDSKPSLQAFLTKSGINSYNATIVKSFLVARFKEMESMTEDAEKMATSLHDTWKNGRNYDQQKSKLLAPFLFLLPAPSNGANQSTYCKPEYKMYELVKLGRYKEDFRFKGLNIFIYWPQLLELEDDKFNPTSPDDTDLKRLEQSCDVLIEEQSRLYNTEHDREIDFYLWLNNELPFFGLPTVRPQIRIPKMNDKGYHYTANGVAWVNSKTSETDLFAGKQIVDVSGDQEPIEYKIIVAPKGQTALKVRKEKTATKDSIGGLTAKEFLMAKGQSLHQGNDTHGRSDVLEWGNVFLIVETKNCSSDLIFCQVGNYIYHLFSQNYSNGDNIPIFSICMDGPCLKFATGVRFFGNKTHVAMTELKTFNLVETFLDNTNSLVKKLAMYFYKFFKVMKSVTEIRSQRKGLNIFFPNRNASPMKRELDNNFNYLLCPKSTYEDFDKVLWDLEYIEQVDQGQQKVFFHARASSPNSRMKKNVFVRIQERYGAGFHKRLSDKKDPVLCPALFSCGNYYEPSSLLQFVVMEKLEVEFKSLDTILSLGPSNDLLNEVSRNLYCLREWLGFEENRDVHHGDIRSCNILVNTNESSPSYGQIRLIDAEFGTDVQGGDTFYPYKLNLGLHKEFCCADRDECRSLIGTKITLEQDLKMLDFVISRVDPDHRRKSNSCCRDE